MTDLHRINSCRFLLSLIAGSIFSLTGFTPVIGENTQLDSSDDKRTNAVPEKPFRRLDANDRSEAISYYNLANKYLEKQRYEDAVDNYHEAIARYANDPDFYVNLGFCYRKLEDFQSAEQAFRKALTLNDKDWVTWSNLANSLLKQNRLKETVTTFEKCLKLNPPASEKAAINRDILDIKKILSMQKPPVTVAGRGALTENSKVFEKKAMPSANKSDKKNLTPARKNQTLEFEPIKAGAGKADSGWDYVYK